MFCVIILISTSPIEDWDPDAFFHDVSIYITVLQICN